jgi:hypothetical protein
MKCLPQPPIELSCPSNSTAECAFARPGQRTPAASRNPINLNDLGQTHRIEAIGRRGVFTLAVSQRDHETDSLAVAAMLE